MTRQKAPKNEIRDYFQSSVYGIVSLSCGLWLVNNYQNVNPYISIGVSAMGIEAFRRWSLVRTVGSKVNSVGATSQQFMASSVKAIFNTEKPELEQDPDVFRIPYRDSNQKIGVHKDDISVFLNEGYSRQLQKKAAPFAMHKFSHTSPRSVWCIWWLVGRCGQFTTTGQGASPLLVTRPYRALGHISHLWPRMSAS